VRIGIVTESFLPNPNGVTTSVCRVLECLRVGGRDVTVLAPRPAPVSWAGYPVHAVASVPVRQFPVGLPTGEVEALLARFAPDVVHVASPFLLGASSLAAAARLGIPSVAVYQTDMPSYLGQHCPGALGRGATTAAWRWVRRVHELADLTLAPSSVASAELEAHGIPRNRPGRAGSTPRRSTPAGGTDQLVGEGGPRAALRPAPPGGAHGLPLGAVTGEVGNGRAPCARVVGPLLHGPAHLHHGRLTPPGTGR
jgi:phosphatidylinositol alpha 1,6-mannosyltransferase